MFHSYIKLPDDISNSDDAFSATREPRSCKTRLAKLNAGFSSCSLKDMVQPVQAVRGSPFLRIFSLYILNKTEHVVLKSSLWV
jgi:hypothetical protein